MHAVIMLATVFFLAAVAPAVAQTQAGQTGYELYNRCKIGDAAFQRPMRDLAWPRP